MYDNLHDAQMRLEGTIIRLGRLPIIISSIYTDYVNGKAKIFLRYSSCVGSEASRTCMLDDKRIDVSSPPLGYVPITRNGKATCVYAVRQPARKQQQGISPHRLFVFPNGSEGRTARNNLTNKQIGIGILGKFNGPKMYEKRAHELEHYDIDVIFSRDIACSWRHVYYKAHVIGTIRHEDNKHIVSVSSSTFKRYNFEGIFDENWRID